MKAYDRCRRRQIHPLQMNMGPENHWVVDEKGLTGTYKDPFTRSVLVCRERVPAVGAVHPGSPKADSNFQHPDIVGTDPKAS